MPQASEALKSALEHAGSSMDPAPKGRRAPPDGKMPQEILAHAAAILPAGIAQKELLESLKNGAFLDSLSLPALESAFLMLMDPPIQSKIDPQLRTRPGAVSFSFTIEGLFDARHHPDARERLFSAAAELTRGILLFALRKKAGRLRKIPLRA